MNDLNIATRRTVQPFAVVAVIVDVVRRATGIELDPTWVLAAATVLGGIAYRAGRTVEARFPRLGWILFGRTPAPTYPTSKED